MIEFRILIPVASNEGDLFSPEHHMAFEAEMLRRFGGFSLLPGLTKGAWSSEGRTYGDDLRTYVVAVPSILDGARIRALLAYARLHYRQEAIYFGVLGFAEVFAGE